MSAMENRWVLTKLEMDASKIGRSHRHTSQNHQLVVSAAIAHPRNEKLPPPRFLLLTGLVKEHHVGVFDEGDCE